jgi:dethiobiotin synthetase
MFHVKPTHCPGSRSSRAGSGADDRSEPQGACPFPGVLNPRRAGSGSGAAVAIRASVGALTCQECRGTPAGGSATRRLEAKGHAVPESVRRVNQKIARSHPAGSLPRSTASSAPNRTRAAEPQAAPRRTALPSAGPTGQKRLGNTPTGGRGRRLGTPARRRATLPGAAPRESAATIQNTLNMFHVKPCAGLAKTRPCRVRHLALSPTDAPRRLPPRTTHPLHIRQHPDPRRTTLGYVKRIVVAGTGTAIGKTFVSCALLDLARSHGHPCLGLKPVESGAADALSDAAQLGRASGVSIPPLYSLRDPLSPHLAAEREGVTIDVGDARHWVRTHEEQLRKAASAARCEALSVVELAGGLFTPLTLTTTNLDLVAALDPCDFVLVAPDRLGVLHDVGAAVRAAQAAHRAPDWIVLNPLAPDHATPFNGRELQRLYPHIPVLVLEPTRPDSLHALLN